MPDSETVVTPEAATEVATQETPEAAAEVQPVAETNASLKPSKSKIERLPNGATIETF